MIKLDYGATNIMLWKIHEKNTVIWEMAGMEEIAEIIAIFNTLNWSNVNKVDRKKWRT